MLEDGCSCSIRIRQKKLKVKTSLNHRCCNDHSYYNIFNFIYKKTSCFLALLES